MKKTRMLIFTFCAIFTLAFVPSKIFAQNNTFDCIETPDGSCIVNTSGPYCNPGYEADENVCTNTPINQCNLKVNNPCRSINQTQMCTCISGVCTTTSNTSLQTIPCDLCNSPTVNAFCAGVNVYKCENYPKRCSLCQRLPDGSYPSECKLSQGDCLKICNGNNTASLVQGNCKQGIGWVDTAIGCIPFNVISETARFFLSWGLGVGGGAALFLIAISAIMLAASSGNPEKVSSAKSLFWSAIAGLGMLIFSVFLLRFIGVDVLGLFS